MRPGLVRGFCGIYYRVALLGISYSPIYFESCDNKKKDYRMVYIETERLILTADETNISPVQNTGTSVARLYIFALILFYYQCL